MLDSGYDAFLYVEDSSLPEETSSSAYLVNCSTGETILEAADYLHFKRRLSYWTPVENLTDLSLDAHPMVWLPSFVYASRAGGARPFSGWPSEESAATHISAVARGFLSRRGARTLIRSRFYSVLSPDCGFIFFADVVTGTSSWHKPILAHPEDIPRHENPENSSAKNQEMVVRSSTDGFSAQSHLDGPFVRRYGAGQRRTLRAKHSAFLVENRMRDAAISQLRNVDTSSVEIGSTIVWKDDLKTKKLLLNDYSIVRSAFAKDGGNNWAEVLSVMKRYSERVLVQCYSLRCFAKGIIPVEESTQIMSFVAKSAFTEIERIVYNQEKKYRYTHIFFALEALFNFLSLRSGRSEFFSTVHIQAIGTQRQRAIQNFFKFKLNMLHQYLQHIPSEEVVPPVILEEDTNSYIQPTSRGCDVVALVFEVTYCKIELSSSLRFHSAWRVCVAMLRLRSSLGKSLRRTF